MTSDSRVRLLLKALEFDEFAEAFERSGVRFQDFPDLTDQALLELGVADPQARSRMREAGQSLGHLRARRAGPGTADLGSKSPRTSSSRHADDAVGPPHSTSVARVICIATGVAILVVILIAVGTAGFAERTRPKPAEPSLKNITRLANVTASSVSEPSLGVTFQSSNLIDERIETAWKPSGVRNQGIGDAFSLRFPEFKGVAQLEIANGLQGAFENPDSFKLYTRLKEVAIEFDGGEIRHTLDDGERGFTVIAINPPVLTKRITVRALSVYTGTLSPDLIVSEVRVFGTSN